MTAKANPFYEVGVRMGAASFGLDRNALIRARGRASVMQSKEAAPFKRELCKIASSAFDADGDRTSAVAVLFRNLSQVDEWHSSYDRFTDPVLRSLAKSGATLLPAAAALHDKTGGGILKTLTAAGVLGGASLGSLAFLLSRNAQQSSAENAQMLEKVRAYKKLKRDIEEDMSNSGAMA